MCFACEGVYVPHACLVPMETRKHLDSLEQEINRVVSSNVGAGNRTCILKPASSARATSSQP